MLDGPVEVPPFPICTDCGNSVDTHGRYVTEFERIVLVQRGDEDEDDAALTE